MPTYVLFGAGPANLHLAKKLLKDPDARIVIADKRLLEVAAQVPHFQRTRARGNIFRFETDEVTAKMIEDGISGEALREIMHQRAYEDSGFQAHDRDVFSDQIFDQIQIRDLQEVYIESICTNLEDRQRITFLDRNFDVDIEVFPDFEEALFRSHAIASLYINLDTVEETHIDEVIRGFSHQAFQKVKEILEEKRHMLIERWGIDEIDPDFSDFANHGFRSAEAFESALNAVHANPLSCLKHLSLTDFAEQDRALMKLTTNLALHHSRRKLQKSVLKRSVKEAIELAGLDPLDEIEVHVATGALSDSIQNDSILYRAGSISELDVSADLAAMHVLPQHGTQTFNLPDFSEILARAQGASDSNPYELSDIPPFTAEEISEIEDAEIDLVEKTKRIHQLMREKLEASQQSLDEVFAERKYEFEALGWNLIRPPRTRIFYANDLLYIATEVPEAWLGLSRAERNERIQQLTALIGDCVFPDVYSQMLENFESLSDCAFQTGQFATSRGERGVPVDVIEASEDVGEMVVIHGGDRRYLPHYQTGSGFITAFLTNILVEEIFLNHPVPRFIRAPRIAINDRGPFDDILPFDINLADADFIDLELLQRQIRGEFIDAITKVIYRAGGYVDTEEGHQHFNQQIAAVFQLSTEELTECFSKEEADYKNIFRKLDIDPYDSAALSRVHQQVLSVAQTNPHVSKGFTRRRLISLEQEFERVLEQVDHKFEAQTDALGLTEDEHADSQEVFESVVGELLGMDREEVQALFNPKVPADVEESSIFMTLFDIVESKGIDFNVFLQHLIDKYTEDLNQHNRDIIRAEFHQLYEWACERGVVDGDKISEDKLFDSYCADAEKSGKESQSEQYRAALQQFKVALYQAESRDIIDKNKIKVRKYFSAIQKQVLETYAESVQNTMQSVHPDLPRGLEHIASVTHLIGIQEHAVSLAKGSAERREAIEQIRDLLSALINKNLPNSLDEQTILETMTLFTNEYMEHIPQTDIDNFSEYILQNIDTILDINRKILGMKSSVDLSTLSNGEKFVYILKLFDPGSLHELKEIVIRRDGSPLFLQFQLGGVNESCFLTRLQNALASKERVVKGCTEVCRLAESSVISEGVIDFVHKLFPDELEDAELSREDIADMLVKLRAAFKANTRIREHHGKPLGFLGSKKARGPSVSLPHIERFERQLMALIKREAEPETPESALKVTFANMLSTADKTFKGKAKDFLHEALRDALPRPALDAPADHVPRQ